MSAKEWNALVDENDPFMEHAFLAALEASGSVSARAGAEPRFVLARDQGRLVGAVPLYLKTNSYGEFIFDWGWANAAHRSGIRYYPKLVAAIPFTPATGQRILVARGETPARADDIAAQLLAGVREVAAQERASSIHVLFCTEAELPWLVAAGLTPRLSMQFHWHNRQPPYRDFADYLGAFKSRHRKQVRHERAVAAGHGLGFETRTGTEMTDVDWRAARAFYEANATKHGGMEYLTPEFFEIIRASYAHRVVATLAYRGDTPVAGTFNFEKGRHVYGRYWGCQAEYSMLHFELCYHRLIDRAIAHQATRFEAGAQGEHKLKRGLVPSYTHSAHWIGHPGLASAVIDFIGAEADAVREQVAALVTESPFHAPAAGAAPDPDDGPPPAG